MFGIGLARLENHKDWTSCKCKRKRMTSILGRAVVGWFQFCTVIMTVPCPLIQGIILGSRIVELYPVVLPCPCGEAYK